MAKNRSRSQTLRHIAEGFLAQVPDDLLGSPRDELATSLVRQWLTNDDYAVIILGNELHRLHVFPQDDGEGSFRAEAIPLEVCFRDCIRDWHLDEKTLRNAASRINLGQSVIVRNRLGQVLRLWVNAKEDSHGIELQTETEGNAYFPLELIERDAIDSLFGPNLSPRIREELAESIDRQWSKYNGHAMLVTGDILCPVRYESGPDFQSKLVTARQPCTLARDLIERGIPADELPHFLHGLNLRQRVQFSDGMGNRVEVAIDPPKGTLQIRSNSDPRPDRKLRFDNL